MKKSLCIGITVIFFGLLGKAQNVDVAAKLGYPQMIVYNGKIVTMDDGSFESRAGTIVQAMAVRDGKILATGSTAEIRALAGPQTKSIDLRGKTVLPNFILTHEHPHRWQFMNARSVTHVFPNDDMILFRWLPSIPAKDQLAMLEQTVKEAVAKAKPGQWINVHFNWGRDFEWSKEVSILFDRSVKKEWLDQLAPNHPLIVQEVLGLRTNQKALDLAQGLLGTQRANVEEEVMLHGRLDLVAAVQKAELEQSAAWGITTYGSMPYSTPNFNAWSLLEKKGELPARWGWAYAGPNFDERTMGILASTLSHGTDHLWLAGAMAQQAGACTTLPYLPGAEEWSAEVFTEFHTGPVDKECRFAPGKPVRERWRNIIKAGLRITGMHSGGDKELDYLMDIIEEASKEAGMTEADIRAKRHTFDHGHGSPRPDQIPRMKRLGMMASQNNFLLWKQDGHFRMRSTSSFAKLHGLEYAAWVQPRKSLTNAGVMSTFEIDRPIHYKIFFFIKKGMDRFNEDTQSVLGPAERADRFIQLKALTRWGAHYLYKENVLGTLEPRKFADFMVLDRDFLAIPENDIPNVKVLMTVVGGKVVHLTSELARESGMQPAGPSTWTEKIPAGW